MFWLHITVSQKTIKWTREKNAKSQNIFDRVKKRKHKISHRSPKFWSVLIWVHGNRDGEGYLPFWSAPNWVSEKTAASGVGAPFIQGASSQLGLRISAFSPAGRQGWIFENSHTGYQTMVATFRTFMNMNILIKFNKSWSQFQIETLFVWA